MTIILNKWGTVPPLLTCPFCSGDDLKLHIDGDDYIVACADCGGQGPKGSTEVTARVLWNSRLIARVVGDKQE